MKLSTKEKYTCENTKDIYFIGRCFLSSKCSLTVTCTDSQTTISSISFESIKKEFADIQMRCSQIDYHSKDQLKKLKLEEYTTVSILAGSGEEAEEIDSKTIMRLLQIRNIFQEHTRDTGKEIDTKLITEIVESENTELVLKAGVKDFLISNQFVSKIFAQVADDPDVMQVYDDLFLSLIHI